jgi:hypothetical protein
MVSLLLGCAKINLNLIVEIPIQYFCLVLVGISGCDYLYQLPINQSTNEQLGTFFQTVSRRCLL